MAEEPIQEITAEEIVESYKAEQPEHQDEGENLIDVKEEA